MTKINDDVERLYYRLDDDGNRYISVSEFTDEDIEALWNYYKSRKHAEE